MRKKRAVKIEGVQVEHSPEGLLRPSQGFARSAAGNDYFVPPRSLRATFWRDFAETYARTAYFWQYKRILYAPSWKNAVGGYISRVSRQKSPIILPESTKYAHFAILRCLRLFVRGGWPTGHSCAIGLAGGMGRRESSAVMRKGRCSPCSWR